MSVYVGFLCIGRILAWVLRPASLVLGSRLEFVRCGRPTARSPSFTNKRFGGDSHA